MTTTDGARPGDAVGRLRTSAPKRPWRLVVVAISAWVLGLVVACAAAIALILGIGQLAAEAQQADSGADMAQELHIAVLTLRHDQQSLAYTGPTRSGIVEFETAYQSVLARIGELEQIAVGSPLAGEVQSLRPLAEGYYTRYKPALDSYRQDPSGFDTMSDRGLVDLSAIEREAEALARSWEIRALGAVGDVRGSASTATLILLAVVIAVAAICLIAAVAAVRMLRDMRRLYALQDATVDQLRAALQSKIEFLADASHELRTPLTVLRGNAEVGLTAGDCERRHEPVFRDIVEEAGRMSRLVEGLLLLARFDAGAPPLAFETVDLEPWLAEVAARGEVLARGRSKGLAVDLRADGRARIDPERLAEAVMILLDNATRLSPPEARVRLRAKVDGSSLVVDVVDRGPGISASAVPTLFERFKQGAYAGGRRSRGAGLGLSIAKAIVVAHGGTIRAASREGRGTRMTIRLPLVAVEPTASGPAGPTGVPAHATRPGVTDGNGAIREPVPVDRGIRSPATPPPGP